MAAAKKKAVKPVEHVCHQAGLAYAIETFLKAWDDDSRETSQPEVDLMRDAYNKWKGDGQ